MEFLEFINAALFSLGNWIAGSTFVQALANEWSILIDSRALLLLGVSIICGALIGLEREHAEKPAGLRTNMMISLGSCLFTLASIYSWQHIAGGSDTVDPGRIAAQVVSGVGFLGAGVVLKTGLQVTGITTAATIWAVAAIGMVVGLGFPLLGFLVAATISLLLFFLGSIELRWGISSKEEDDA